MANYSSDSDSEKSSKRHRRKHQRRSSSVDSINSSSSYQKRQKYSKSRRRHRSRSKSRDRDRSSRSHKHSRNTSKDRRKHRSHRSRSASVDRNKSKKRSASREKSTSRSSSSQSNVKALNPDKPTIGPKVPDNFLTAEPRIKPSVLDDINNDEFVPKQFVSSAKDKESKTKNIVIDISGDTIHVPQLGTTPDVADSIFHISIMADKEAKFDRWVKKLYTLRQKAINELNSTS